MSERDYPATSTQPVPVGQVFAHSIQVHVIGLAGFIFFGVIGLLAFFGVGDSPERALGVLLELIALFFALVYLVEGRRTYELRDEGLLIASPFGKKLLPYKALQAISYGASLRLVTFRIRGMRSLRTSADYYPGLVTLCREIWRRSDCQLSDDVRIALNGEDETGEARWPGSGAWILKPGWF